MPSPKLHHCAMQITRGSLDTVLELFEQLCCRVSYREEGATWAMVEQEGLRFDLQLVEVDHPTRAREHRLESHIAFLSPHPAQDIDRIQTWCTEHGLSFYRNSWNDKEHYFDCPDLFVNFVIEIMDQSVVE